ncbi:uncharacterized protein LOC115627819 [Scaptodrosophila lebanonensis]|uniref:Uncharacterized protein LOC115627819 n=1 Tax=Drosophila lebanonensis TaxID=7225 RepID=A0A6J2TX94_DROLE|nr:uncharacterized protein LOC115627819 [Scaptodrosophila lebanonensis]
METMGNHRIWLLCICLSICWQNGGANKSAQRAEIAKLRTELSAALEEEQPDLHGVIVQPTWTNTGSKTAAVVDSKVVVDKTSLSETSALRSEINSAVASNSYARADPGNAAEVRALEAALSGKGSTQQVPNLGKAHDKMELLGGSQQTDERTSTNQPNVVDSNAAEIIGGEAEIDLAQLQRLELSKRRTREMLVLKRIVEDFSFTLGADVEQWAHVQHNGSGYFVGRRRQDLVLLSSTNSSGYQQLQTLPLSGPVTAMMTFERWDSKAHLQEGVILMALERQLFWYRYDAVTGYSLHWTWQLGTNVTSLVAFMVENREYLALTNNQSISIYGYDLAAGEFWIEQRLQLGGTCTALAVLDTGRDLLLAVGRENKTLIYAYNSRVFSSDAGLRFRLRHSLESPQIGHIAAFQMGGRSYLALGGQRPQIMLYSQGQLHPRTILGQNFGVVELFLPVPVRTYRDDLLLLVQHRVQFDTHHLVVLETLVWNGDTFEASVPAPCELGSQVVHIGVGCMLDIQRDAGLKGAALLRQGDIPLLLVPRHDAESGLFRLYTELLPRNSELHDLQEIYEFMRHWVSEQDELVLAAQQLLEASQPQKHLNFDEVNTPLLIVVGAEVQALHINDVPWTEADVRMNVHWLLQQLRLLDHDLLGEGATEPESRSGYRFKRQPQLFPFNYESLEFDFVEAQELHVEQFNNELFYVQDSSLQFEGTLNVQQLEVLEPKDDIIPRTVDETNTTTTLNSTMEHLQINGDIICEYINDIPWSEFVKQLVWRNKALELPQLNVHGAVVFEQSLEVSTLNKLSFPGDYLWSNANITSIVAAPKTFTQTLSVNAVDTDGLINGVNPLDAITLRDAQDWPGVVTFTQLEVSRELDLHGSAQGRQIEQAPTNPTLAETHLIQAACHFSQLVVNGNLILQGRFDNDSFDSLIGDIAQRPRDPAAELVIPSVKRFSQLVLPVDTHVQDGAISCIPIEQFVTKHTPQTLHNLTHLAGYIYFHSLKLSGFYDGVDLGQLLQQALRIDEPQDAPDTQLHFVNGGELWLAPPVDVKLRVTHTLNDVPLATGYQMLHETIYMEEAQFENLSTDVLDVAGGVQGKGMLNGRNISDHTHDTNSNWTGNLHVQDLILPQGVRAEKLHGINSTRLLGLLQQLDELPLLILSGQLQVDRIIVSGDVQVSGALNGQNFEQLLGDVVWLNRPNDLRTRWTFGQPPIFAKNLQVLGTFNERLFPELVADIVFRSNDSIVIEGTKSFVQPLRVLDQLQLEALNGVPCKYLANKVQPIEFSGTLRIPGRLYVGQLEVEGTLNGYDVNKLEKLLRWDPHMKAYVHRGVVRIAPQHSLNDITVYGHWGHRNDAPLMQFFEELLYKNQPVLLLEGEKNFTGRVSIRGGAQIGELNGLKLDDLLHQLIFINEGAYEGRMITVHTPVYFKAPVVMEELLIKDRLVLGQSLLNGCNMSDWLRDTLRVDRDWQTEQPLLFAPGSLDNNALNVRRVNGLDLACVVTLHTEQKLNVPLLLLEELYVDGHINVRGLVNELNLSEEYANTLMKNPTHAQTVSTPLLMQSLHVTGALHVPVPVNGDPNLNLSDVASLSEPKLRLRTPLYFARIHTPHLQTSHHISGIDFKHWHQNSLWARGRPMQYITGNWSVGELLVRQPPAVPSGQIPEHSLYRRRTAMDEFQALCERFKNIFQWLRFPYHVQRLERRFVLSLKPEQKDIRRIFEMKAPVKEGSSYLLINERGCWTRVYRWNGTLYIPAGSFESGPVDDVYALEVENNASSTNGQWHFMTSFEFDGDETQQLLNCSSPTNLNSWRTTAESVELMNLPASLLKNLQQQRQAQQRLMPVSYPRALKYLSRPNTDSVLRPHLQAPSALSYEDYHSLLSHLLEDLSFRLHTEVNITQLSIPESDLFDEHLVEDFLAVMQSLQTQQLYDPKSFLSVAPETLQLPDNPARVLAARSVQLIWPVIVELEALHGKLPTNATHAHDLCVQLKRSLGLSVRDVLLIANRKKGDTKPVSEDYTPQLHAVIARLRQLQQHLQQLMQPEKEEQEEGEEMMAAASNQDETMSVMITAAPLQTIRLVVGDARRPRLLYARLTIATKPPVVPSTAPPAHIQLHYANGTLFQSLAAAHTARQLTALRVRDQTLLAFAENCCRVRVFIYRGVQGFVSFADFTVEQPIVELLTMRLPLRRPPGAMYALAVAHPRQIVFYELVIMGLLEPWMQCT